MWQDTPHSGVQHFAYLIPTPKISPAMILHAIATVYHNVWYKKCYNSGYYADEELNAKMSRLTRHLYDTTYFGSVISFRVICGSLI